MQPENRAEDICFSLGETCRDDFLEILFLAVNGHGAGAIKLLRGLYERAVTIAYLMQHPEKAERFVRYAALQEHRALMAALKIVSEDEFDAAVLPKTTAAEIRKYYEEVKGEFQQTVCKHCKTSRIAATWDTDFASVVEKVGEPYKRYYLGAYAIPNFEIHATLTSAYRAKEITQNGTRPKAKSPVDAEFALSAIASQNLYYSLNLDEDLTRCELDLEELWMKDKSVVG